MYGRSTLWPKCFTVYNRVQQANEAIAPKLDISPRDINLGSVGLQEPGHRFSQKRAGKDQDKEHNPRHASVRFNHRTQPRIQNGIKIRR